MTFPTSLTNPPPCPAPPPHDPPPPRPPPPAHTNSYKFQVSTLQETKAGLFYWGGREGCVGMGRGRKKLIENRSNLFMMISGMSIEF